MKLTSVRWWSIFSVTFLTSLYLLIGGGANFIAKSDVTYISWLIIAVFLTGSIHAGFVAKKIDKTNSVLPIKEAKHISEFFSNTCGSLGMLGTIIGLIIAMMGSLSEIDASNVETIKGALTSISSGVGSALVTTMIGLLSVLSLEMQWASNKLGWAITPNE